ncbi:MAG: rane protein [Mucilaginibacter sp.]|nr:rane protein [Mucilaginibacter sp.]
MNTKLLMILSALFMAAIGISLTFLPNEIANSTGIGPSKTLQLVLQISGALYFAFAMLNWMAKGSIIGGIYNKPIATANFTHFVIGALALIKTLLNDHSLPYPIWVLAGVYSIFAVVFGVVFFGDPVSNSAALNNKTT